MSLTVYRNISEIPGNIEYIDGNDSFFNVRTKLKNTTFCKDVLSVIDQASYLDENEFYDRRGVSVYSSELSTGAKTLLNIESHPDVCFDVLECGENALELIPRIKNGNIVWEHIIVFPDNEEECDIIYHKHHFDKFFDFLDFVNYEDSLDYEEENILT